MPPVYPVNDYGPLMPGLVMAAVAIFHVFLAQFAVGGGFSADGYLIVSADRVTEYRLESTELDPNEPRSRPQIV